MPPPAVHWGMKKRGQTGIAHFPIGSKVLWKAAGGRGASCCGNRVGWDRTAALTTGGLRAQAALSLLDSPFVMASLTRGCSLSLPDPLREGMDQDTAVLGW